MAFLLDPFYLIAGSSEWLARLLPCGVKFVQLRIKDNPDSQGGNVLGLPAVVPGLEPGIQTPGLSVWMAGSSPATTAVSKPTLSSPRRAWAGSPATT